MWTATPDTAAGVLLVRCSESELLLFENPSEHPHDWDRLCRIADQYGLPKSFLLSVAVGRQVRHRARIERTSNAYLH